MAADRKQFLGGSEAAAVLGLSPWATPLGIYRRKVGEISDDFELDPERQKIFKRGKRMEPVVIEMLEDEHQLKVTKRSPPTAPNRYADPEFDFLAAEIDFEWEVSAENAEAFGLPAALIGTTQNGEIKTVHPWGAAKYGEEGTDEIPIEYASQAMHGLMVTGRQVCLFGVLVGSDNLVHFVVRRDEEVIAGMRERELAFWRENVLAKVPPQPQDYFDVLLLFSKKRASRVVATPESSALVQQLRGAGDRKREAEDAEEELKFQLGVILLGEASVVRDKDGKAKPAAGMKPGTHALVVPGAGPKGRDLELLTVALQGKDSVDVKLLRERHPDVAAECAKHSEFFVFRPKRSKA